MEKETQKETLRRLFVENNLVQDDVFKHKFYTIITRSGIDKIQAANNIDIKYNLIFNSDDTKCVIIKATAQMGDKTIETFGEAAPMNNSNGYPVAMAEKRAMSRSVLKLAGFYQLGVFSEDESDDFKRS
mgnify:CR=1 FL=1|tara:strand:- start:6775 stop:7161 length:387 start_codon:yes stop_codon:yes gene_type:complete